MAASSISAKYLTISETRCNGSKQLVLVTGIV